MRDDFNEIDDATPIDDISGLRIAGIRTRAELDPYEAENIRKATVKYLAARPSKRLAPFTLSWLYKLHRDMLGDVWSWAGQKRRSEKSIGVEPHRIDEELTKLLDDLRYWPTQADMDHHETTARLHHRAVQIHPFENGNGRWSRMLVNIWLLQNGHPIIAWPDQPFGHTSPIRGEYIRAMKGADAFDLEPLVELHRRYSSDR